MTTNSTAVTMSVREKLAFAREDATKLREVMKELKEARAKEIAERKKNAEIKKLMKGAAIIEREKNRAAKEAERLAKVEARNAKMKDKIDKMMSVGKGLKSTKRKVTKPSEVTVTTAEGTKTVPATKASKKKA